MTEGRSTGIPKILRAMKANSLPSPGFDFDEDHTYFMFRYGHLTVLDGTSRSVKQFTFCVGLGLRKQAHRGGEMRLFWRFGRKFKGSRWSNIFKVIDWERESIGHS